YMLAARDIYQSGAALEKVAREKTLEPDVLQKWVRYLKPGPESRPWLNEWRSATPDKMPEVARDYQKRFEDRSAKWNKTMSAYRARSRKMLAEKNMPPPNKPEFDAATDPFFFDVYFGTGPFAIPEKEEEKFLSAEARAELARLRKE